MAQLLDVETRTEPTRAPSFPVIRQHPSRQAYLVLYCGFIALPIVAGLDKFFQVLTNWEQYLAPQVANVLPVSAHSFMLTVGVIEIAAGILVALWPRVGALLVAFWLLGIVVNLLLAGYYDVALRDFGLSLGALALARLSGEYSGVMRFRT